MAIASVRNIVTVCAGCCAVFAADSTLDDTRSTLEKWVETRQLISRTRSDWHADKELLEQQIALFERELKNVTDSSSKFENTSAQAAKERNEAEATIKASEAALAVAKNWSADFQSQIAKLAQRFPAPLQETLKPLLSRLPADPASTKMPVTEQAQVIVGILNEVDKFNNSVAIFSEKRKNERGEEIAVQAVYVGLGAAYFVNDAGDFAGVGVPAANGWEWSIKPDIGGAVKDVVRIYRNENAARFVALPVSIR